MEPRAVAEKLAREAGDVIRKNFSLGMKKEWKEDLSPVTETDRAINALVLQELKAAYPDHQILSEEGDDLSGSSEYVWVCDPVDGTKNFSHGIATATFALTLTHGGLPVLAVIYDPFMDRLFTAEKGKGATLNGRTIHVTPSSILKNTMIGIGKIEGVRDLYPLMQAGKKHGTSFITGLSIHHLCALVAAGEFVAALFGGTSPHDMTAGKLLVEEAGGKATDLFGRTPERYDRDMDGQIVTNGILHEEILALIDPKHHT